MTRPFLAALCALAALASPPARAQFEGRLDYTLSGFPDGKGSSGGTAQATTWLSPAGARSETLMPMPGGQGGPRQVRVVTLVKAAEPRKTWLLNEQRKVYAVVDAGDLPKSGAQYEVTRLGPDRVAGRACEKARVTAKGLPGSHELCVSKELGKLSLLSKMGSSGADDLPAALRAAGLDAMPVRWRSLDEKGKTTFSMELTRAQAQKVPAKMLEIPAGYQETGAATVFATPDQARQMEDGMKQMQEQLKDLPPEQRRQIEEMMKKSGKGK